MSKNNWKSKLSVDIYMPIYNEGERLVRNTKEIVDRINIYNDKARFKVLLVNDNSSDNTRSYMVILEKKFGVKMINFSSGPTRRENLAIAMAKSRADYVMFMDFDLATDLSKLEEVIRYMNYGYDVIIGSRYVPGSNLKRSLRRLVLSKMYNLFVRIYYGSSVHDHNCGFKAFRLDAYKLLSSQAGYDQSLTRGWFWDVEILIRAQKNEMKIKEFPVSWLSGEQSSFSLKRELRMLPYILSLRFRI